MTLLSTKILQLMETEAQELVNFINSPTLGQD